MRACAHVRACTRACVCVLSPFLRVLVDSSPFFHSWQLAPSRAVLGAGTVYVLDVRGCFAGPPPAGLTLVSFEPRAWPPPCCGDGVGRGGVAGVGPLTVGDLRVPTQRGAAVAARRVRRGGSGGGVHLPGPARRVARLRADLPPATAAGRCLRHDLRLVLLCRAPPGGRRASIPGDVEPAAALRPEPGPEAPPAAGGAGAGIELRLGAGARAVRLLSLRPGPAATEAGLRRLVAALVRTRQDAAAAVALEGTVAAG